MVWWVSLCRANKQENSRLFYTSCFCSQFQRSLFVLPVLPHISIITQAIFSFDATNLIFFPTCSILSPGTHSELCKMKSPHQRLTLISDCPLFVKIAFCIFDNGLNQGRATQWDWYHDPAGFSDQPGFLVDHQSHLELESGWLHGRKENLAGSCSP